jgi:hypothetical protein
MVAWSTAVSTEYFLCVYISPPGVISLLQTRPLMIPHGPITEVRDTHPEQLPLRRISCWGRLVVSLSRTVDRTALVTKWGLRDNFLFATSEVHSYGGD